jgi:hypothetical protein
MAQRINSGKGRRPRASRGGKLRITLARAIRGTFASRQLPLPTEEPFGLTAAYWDNPSRPAQIRAFARRAALAVGEEPGREILAVLRPFLLPILDDLRRGAAMSGTWPPGGPWGRKRTGSNRRQQSDSWRRS